ncbi:prenyltransferase/squalene oxidase repeat-containing protein [Streptomyces monomycini]|uniref:prenyltransferase/squalene oxidase repeat-containing protein n=1 Tax=Streptomyces monomycini TaxID=371720 RepID=UPI00067D4D58|nr:prenyltransferase/squalene oxidase repeat-containing protein [Streptomyces monomycini]
MTAHGYFERQATALLTEAAADDLGRSTPSVYESGRLVSDAPWLAGHALRLHFLCTSQNPDGSWGSGEHGLVATLSAAEALLSELTLRNSIHLPRPQLVHTAALAVTRLNNLLGDHLHPPALPDTIEAGLITPALIEQVQQRLGHCGHANPPFLLPWAPSLLFAHPTGCRPAALARLRSAVYEGRALPQHLWRIWEILAPATDRPHLCIRPRAGTVGCSPAATAAWLGSPATGSAQQRAGLSYLHRVQARYQGPVPATAPTTITERARIAALFARHRIPHTPPPALISSLRSALDTNDAPSLLLDADETATVLYVLLHHRERLRPDHLMLHYTDDHFRRLPGEAAPSPVANAHALETLALYTVRQAGDRGRYRTVLRQVLRWLLVQQQPDGSWHDSSHASPYYATACCTQALATCAGPAARPALARAAAWALATGRPNGRWGRAPACTAEETAYATWILLAGAPQSPAARHALTAARRVLHHAHVSDRTPALWYGKDTYAPLRILQATRLAALHTLYHLPNPAPVPWQPARAARTTHSPSGTP